jgi:hypothetical protein
VDSRISVRPAQWLKLTALLKISALAQLVHPRNSTSVLCVPRMGETFSAVHYQTASSLNQCPNSCLSQRRDAGSVRNPFEPQPRLCYSPSRA